MQIRVCLAGNPNCGKTTLFNRLTDSDGYVGNWSGVTVEQEEKKYIKNKNIIIADLPGIYSLSPYSPEEIITRDYILIRKPDVIINIIDAANLERSLYLTMQLIESGIPVVIALNMIDIIVSRGERIDKNSLSASLGCPVIETSALKGTGIDELITTAADTLKRQKNKPKTIKFSSDIESVLFDISSVIFKTVDKEKIRWYAIKIFERDEFALKSIKLSENDFKNIERKIQTLETKYNDSSDALIIDSRYKYITETVKKCFKRNVKSVSISDRIDTVMTNKYLALPLFFIIIFVIYFISVSTLGAKLSEYISSYLYGGGGTFFGIKFLSISGILEILFAKYNAAQWLRSLVLDGIVSGVGSVLGFLPQMFFLFFFLSFLEDCGYMSRAAFITDRIFKKTGLSGKSFIPMLVSSGCGVSGIMASKTIENIGNRRMTIITATFIPCSAKLTVITLIAGTIFKGKWWTAPIFYFLGIGSVILSCIILKKTKIFTNDSESFVMEIPPYHMPTLKLLLCHTLERCKEYVIKSGTVIFLACIVLWFLSNFSFDSSGFAAAKRSESIIAVLGKIISPLFAPLGFGNWQSAVLTISGFAAKENIAASFGVLFQNDIVSGFSSVFPSRMSAVSFLIFNLFSAPCVAAVNAIRREMGSIKLTLFAVCYQMIFAYTISFLTYHIIGPICGEVPFSAATVFSFLFIALLIFIFIKHDKSDRIRLKTH